MDLNEGAVRYRVRSMMTLMLLGGLFIACGGGKSVKTDPAPLSATQKMRLSDSYMKAGRVGDALEAIGEALETDPTDPKLHMFRGGILFQSGRHEEAEQSYRSALQYDPHLSEARIHLGAVYQEMGDLSRAEETYRKVLEDASYSAPQQAYFGLGLAYSKQGRDREAVDAMRHAVEIDPKLYRAHLELASLLEKIGMFVEAVREYEVAEPGFLGQGEYHFRRGMAYFRLKQSQKAREQLMRVIDVSPGSHNAAKADELLQVLDEQ